MSLTRGNGPFGKRPAGAFNLPMPSAARILYFEDSPRRVRTCLGGVTLADSRQMKLLHEYGSPPVYYFPEDDVNRDLLSQSGRIDDSDVKGRTVHWHAHAGHKVVEDAAFAHIAPPRGAEFLRGYIAFAFDAMDEWLEEDQPIEVGPKDPYRRVDVLPTSRHVRVLLDGQVLADSRCALALFESGLRPRWYLPLDHVRTDLLMPSSKRTKCPYKGEARYFDVRSNGRVEEDVAWAYTEPYPEAARVKGHVAFLDERLDLEIDAETLRYDSPFGSGRRSDEM
jgi:uncharacterized protein (DUF427 family)